MIWLMIVGAGLATFGTRAFFILLPASWQLPPKVQNLLGYVPVAVFAALAAPGLRTEGTAPTLASSKILAGVVSAYVAWHTKRLEVALLVGMAVYGLDVWVSQ